MKPIFAMLSAILLVIPLASCGQKKLAQDDVGIAGMVPPLALTMTDAATGRPVTAADFRGRVTLLYFGYTNCPDVCPDTLAKMDQIFSHLGPLARKVDFLFVTVDPRRDSASVLKQYTGLFGPHIKGLRGTPNQLFRLARRYRVVFTVHPSRNPEDYVVTHSSSIYVFAQNGEAQFLISELGVRRHPDLGGISDDLRRIILHPPHQTILDRIAAIG